jgi:hypothetical protein
MTAIHERTREKITHQSSDHRRQVIWWTALGVSLATALLVVAPFFVLGNASGHDFEFHAASWLDAAGQWKEGIFFPRWTEWANHGFGEPRFIFYPPLSWMLGAALGSFLPWNAVPVVFIVLTQTVAGLCAFALARTVTSRSGALFGAGCYAANPYALLVVYMRSDFAEQLAAAFFPLLLLLALRVCGVAGAEKREGFGNTCDSADMGRSGVALPQRRSRDIAWFGVVFAVVWLANAPAGVMASYTVALLFAWAVWRERSLWLGLRGAGALLLGFGLTAFYLLPAAYEQKWVSIEQALSSGLQPAENFLYTVTADPEHTLFNWIASSMAILLIVVTGGTAILSRRKDTLDGLADSSSAVGDDRRERLWLVMSFVAIAATMLMLRFTDIFWRLLPKLRFIQFPWRWMAVLAVCCAFFLACAFGRARHRWIFIVVVAAFSVGTAALLIQQTWWDTEDIPTLRAAIADGAGFDGTDEYDPQGDDHYDLPGHAAQAVILNAEDPEDAAPPAKVQIEKWTASDRRLRVFSPQASRVALRLLDYPGWRVEVNGTEVTPQHAEGLAQIVVPLPAGTSQIRAHLVMTGDRKVGAGISLASLLVGVPLLLSGRRHRPKTHGTLA